MLSAVAQEGLLPGEVDIKLTDDILPGEVDIKLTDDILPGEVDNIPAAAGGVTPNGDLVDNVPAGGCQAGI